MCTTQLISGLANTERNWGSERGQCKLVSSRTRVTEQPLEGHAAMALPRRIALRTAISVRHRGFVEASMRPVNSQIKQLVTKASD